MTYRKRLTLLIMLDTLIVISAIYIASWIVFPTRTDWSPEVIGITIISLLVFHFLFAYIFNLYNKVWSYASINELKAIVYSVSLTNISTSLVQFFANYFSVYRRAMVVTWLIHITLIGGSRFIWRVFRDHYINPNPNLKRTLIVGAGNAGAMIARQLTNGHTNTDLNLIDRKSVVEGKT